MRYAVVFALFVLSMITYIDRVCISTARDPMARDLALSDSAMCVVFSAFALGYALAQIPSGWFADRYGPRLAPAAVVTAWSGLTALTGAAWSFVSLVAIRFLFGVGEAGAYPGSARAICNWLPPGERGRADGALFSGSRLGAAFAFPLLAWMLGRRQWRTAFALGADMTVSPSWVYCADIAGRNAGGVPGWMNMPGNLGSFVSANAFPCLQGPTGSTSAYFVAAAALNLAGIWCWFRMRSVDLEKT